MTKPAYDLGHTSALVALGLSKTAAPAPIAIRQRKDPFTEVHNKIKKVLQVKMPNFDMAASLKRVMGNPLKQPRLHLSGNGPAMRI